MHLLQIQWLCGSKEEAQHVVNILLEKRLIACANMCEVSSYYVWNGKQEKRLEIKVEMKTLSRMFDRVAGVISEHGSYQVPCIMGHLMDHVNRDYLSWVIQSVEPMKK